MKQADFIEKIAQVRLKEQGEPFTQFFGSDTYPLTFPIDVAVDFLNIAPNTLYHLTIEIVGDSLSVVYTDTTPFSIPEDNLIYLIDGYGHSYVTTSINFKVLTAGAYRTTFALKKDGVELSSFSNYYYFGDLANDR